MVFFDGVGEVFVVLIEFGGLVDEMEDAERVVFEEVDDWFVVLEADVVGEFSETLSHEFVLLLFEDVRDVKLLEFLVGEVDEKLFKRIDIEHLETKDIEKANTFSIIVGVFLVL